MDLKERLLTMDLLIEFIFELIFDGSIELAKSQKISKWIRYPLIAILSFLILAIIFLMGFIAVALFLSYLAYSFLGGLVLFAIDILLIISLIKNIIKEKN